MPRYGYAIIRRVYFYNSSHFLRGKEDSAMRKYSSVRR